MLLKDKYASPAQVRKSIAKSNITNLVMQLVTLLRCNVIL